MNLVTLELTDHEARLLHGALSVTVELLAQVQSGAGSLLQNSDRPALIQVARRLDHEQRHHGGVPNPNGP